jgi:hypothetical protein
MGWVASDFLVVIPSKVSQSTPSPKLIQNGNPRKKSGSFDIGCSEVSSLDVRWSNVLTRVSYTTFALPGPIEARITAAPQLAKKSCYSYTETVPYTGIGAPDIPLILLQEANIIQSFVLLNQSADRCLNASNSCM